MNLKALATAVLAVGVCSGSLTAQAARTEYTGTVAIIRVHDSVEGANKSWFTLDGFTSWGSCGTSNGGVLLRLRDDENGKRQFAMLTAAEVSGRKVRVGVDDTLKDNLGYCWAWYLDFPPE